MDHRQQNVGDPVGVVANHSVGNIDEIAFDDGNSPLRQNFTLAASGAHLARASADISVQFFRLADVIVDQYVFRYAAPQIFLDGVQDVYKRQRWTPASERSPMK